MRAILKVGFNYKICYRTFKMSFWSSIKEVLPKKRYVIIGFKLILLAGYLVYLGFALAHRFGDEGSLRLVGCTALGAWLWFWFWLKNTVAYTKLQNAVKALNDIYSKGKRRKFIRWFLYVAMTAFMIVYVIIFVAMESPSNLRSLIGLVVLPVMLYMYSNNKTKINWHTIYWSMALQFIMALLILKTSWGASIIQWFGSRLEELVANGEAGSVFIFGEKYYEHPFVFKSMVQVFVLIVGMSVLTYLGVIKFIVETLGRALAFCLGTSPAEGIDAVGNIFLHIPESAMLIQEYLAEMTPSQLFVTYAGGLSTVGGVALVIFMTAGVPAAPLVAASAMSAPAALAASKLAYPSHDEEGVPVITDEHNDSKEVPQELKGILRHPTSIMDSIVLGISQSVVLVVQAVAFCLTAIIALEFLNNTVMWFTERLGYDNINIEYLVSYLFYPFAYIMGAPAQDCLFIGKLLGVRTFSLAIIAFPKLGPIIQNGLVFREYTAASINNTWTVVGNDIYLDNLNQTLVGGVIDHRSEIIATYALCGSASFAVMGHIVGSFVVIVPHRMEEVTRHIFRAMIVGTVASYLTACFAGLLYESDIS